MTRQANTETGEVMVGGKEFSRQGWTNRYGVDEGIAQAIISNRYYGPHVADASISDLLQPPQKAWLESQHGEEIERDVIDNIWAYFGSVAHQVAEDANRQMDDRLSEERLYMDAGGWTVTGKPDAYVDGNGLGGTIIDYKVTSAWSFVFTAKADWEAQLNLYALLYRRNGFPVSGLEIHAILRDWQKRRASEDDYPSAPFIKAPVPLWPEAKQEEFLLERIALHRAARAGNPVPCDDAARWKRDDVYAVMKPKQKKAVRLFGNQADAEALIEEKRPLPHTIEFRKGASARCADYCEAAPFCPQWAKEQELQVVEEK